MKANTTQNLENVFKKTVSSNQIHEAILFVENKNGNFSYNSGYGGKNLDSPMVIASITKLFTSACILTLLEQGRLSLDDKLTKYFDEMILDGLHFYENKEYSGEITLYDLLFQTSGLPNAYDDTKDNLKNRIIHEDAYIDFNEMIALTKNLKPHFIPQTRQKAYYADINFDMMGEIIEAVTEMPLEQAYQKLIFEPLKLKNTYLPTNMDDFISHVFYKNKALHRPRFIMCSRASGGCISTARELMIFLKAFFGERLFNKDILSKFSFYRKMQLSMSPMRYGCGHMQIPLGSAATLFQGKGELVGHSGSTGSFAFYYPAKDLFFVGDVNQMANPAIPVRLSIQLALSIK